MSTPRVRIAPSPTGSPQIGNARTALFNYLFARATGGTFVLRIEDTDLERSDKKYEKDIFEGFHWLGVDPDEGPEQGGPYVPYRQTERTEQYKACAERLLKEGNIFYCFHSEQELTEEKQRALAEKKPPIHWCEFRSMDPVEAAVLTETKTDYILRFKTPAGKTIVFNDIIRGELRFESDLIGDFSVAKRLDMPLYNFAVVVDDETMKITHVIRGEEHVPNTPRQIMLIEALGFERPQYAHLSLILGSDRSKLSKRHGATPLVEYKKLGYLPEALFNFIALLGWHPSAKEGEKEQEIFSQEELIQLFSLERVQKSGAIFDSQKLDWMNGEYIRMKPIAELANLCLPYLKEYLAIDVPIERYPMDYIEQVVQLEQPRLKRLSEIGERTDYFFRDPSYDKELLCWKNAPDEALKESLEKTCQWIADATVPFTREALEKFLLDAIGTGDKGLVLWPLRVALSGKRASPGPFEIMAVLGKEQTLKRLDAARIMLIA